MNLVKIAKKLVAETETLNSFAFDNVLDEGNTEIWYHKPDRFQFDNYEIRKSLGTLPNPKDLDKTHVLLGKVKSTDLDKIYVALQGNLWSPEGEAKNFIRSKGLRHTSMSIGDCIKIGNKVWMVDSVGFEELEVPSNASFNNLNDFAVFHEGLDVGGTEIWYQKPTRGMFDNYKFREKLGTLPNPKDLSKTHVLLGEIKERSLENIYGIMQGENWSPKGEANRFIHSKGLEHTSMSIGDCIKTGGKVWFVDGFGFKELK